MRNQLVMAGTLLLAACNPVAALDEAGQEIDRFHQQLDAGQTEAIWSNTDEELRKITPKSAFTDFLTQTREALGAFESSERQGFNINTFNGTTQVSVTMQTTYANAPATEHFVYIQRNSGWRMAGYQVNAPTLVQQRVSGPVPPPPPKQQAAGAPNSPPPPPPPAG